jgi:hypothetical protein
LQPSKQQTFKAQKRWNNEVVVYNNYLSHVCIKVWYVKCVT